MQLCLWLECLSKGNKAMKAALTKKPLIRIAVVESDPLRFAGFHALFDSEPDLELISASLLDIGAQQNIDLVLLGNYHGQNLLDVMACLKASRPQLRIIVTGSGMDEQTILKAIAEGAKGYVDAAASPADFVQAIRIVSRGSVWVPRRSSLNALAIRPDVSFQLTKWPLRTARRKF